MKKLAVAVLVSLLAGCVSTHVAMLNDAQHYAPTQSVAILLEKPSRPYAPIAILESKGAAGLSQTELLEDIRTKAKAIGADAVIPITMAETRTPQNLLYNPWLGGYQTVGGNTMPVVKALAIKYK